MRLLITLLAPLCLSLLPACQSTKTLTVSYQGIEIPAEPKAIDPVTADIKAEPARPQNLPAATDYSSADARAQQLGLWAIALRKWGRGMVTAIEAREAADTAIIERQKAERAAALARLKALQDGESGD